MPIKALPWHRPHTEQPSEHIVDIIELLRSYGLPSNTDIGFSAMAVHAGLSIKNMVSLSNCTARPCSQCPLRADEYKRLNFFLPICSMSSSSHLFSFAPCHHNLTYSYVPCTQVLLFVLQLLPSFCPPAPQPPSARSCSPSLDQINFLRQSVRFCINFIWVGGGCLNKRLETCLPLYAIKITF